MVTYCPDGCSGASTPHLPLEHSVQGGLLSSDPGGRGPLGGERASARGLGWAGLGEPHVPGAVIRQGPRPGEATVVTSFMYRWSCHAGQQCCTQDRTSPTKRID